jgi:hypothetical protein
VPTGWEEKGYAFRFRSSDAPEPSHVHVEGHGEAAKVWIDEVELASSKGYTPRQVNEIVRIVRSHQSAFLERWHEFFG